MENEKIFKALSEDESGTHADEDIELEAKEIKDVEETANNNLEKESDFSGEKLSAVFDSKIDSGNISGYHPSNINGVNQIGLFYRDNFGNLLVDLKCTEFKKSIGFTIKDDGQVTPMDKRSNSVLKESLNITKEDLVDEVKSIVDKLIPDSVIEEQKQYFYWETEEDLLKIDKEEGESRGIPNEEDDEEPNSLSELELDDKRLEVVESINEVIPDPIGKIMTKQTNKAYDMALVFKNLVILESRVVGKAAYMIPVNIETEGKTRDEVYEQITKYFGFTRKELRDQFGAESQKHPDHKLSPEEFTKNMTKLISLKYKEKISDKISEIIKQEKNADSLN